jgi:uncharacterized protein
VISRTELVIERPERWAKQLSSHLGNKAEHSELAGEHTLKFGFGAIGRISTSDNAVLLEAEADDAESLARAQHVLGSHLLRFAKLENVELSWS